MPTTPGTPVPSARRGVLVVATALLLTGGVSGLAWADLSTEDSRGVVPPALAAVVDDEHVHDAGTPHEHGVVDAVSSVGAPVESAIGTAQELTCSVLDGAPVCRHHDQPAQVAEGARGAEAPEVPVQCDGDGRSGNRLQVLYVRQSDKPDRYASVVANLRRYVNAANGVVHRSSNGARQLRVVTDGSCQAVIEPVTLSPAQAASFAETTSALRASGRHRVDRKYLVFMDNNRGCGLGEYYLDDRPAATNRNNDGNTYGVVYTPCWNGVITAHEIVHMLGSVQSSAPNSTGKYGHCTDQYDVMCYADGSGKRMTTACPSSAATLLDCRGDDYFSVSPPAGSYLAGHWNTAANSFLVGGGAPVPTAPSAPVAPSSSQAGDVVTLRWGTPDQARSGLGGFDLVDLAENDVLASLGGNVRSANVQLEPWRTYRLAVVAWNSAGRSAPAGSFEHTTGTAPESPGQVVATYTARLQALRLQLLRVHLTWAAAEHAEEYVVYRDGVVIGTTRTASFTDARESETGERHTYSVQARNRWGTSRPSQPVVAVSL